MKMALIFNLLTLIIYIIVSIIILDYAYLYLLIMQASGKIRTNSSWVPTIKIVHIFSSLTIKLRRGVFVLEHSNQKP